MGKLLVIRASMMDKSISKSNELTNRFLSHYKTFNPNDEIIEIDLNNLEMAQKTMNRNNLGTFFNEKDSDFYINQLKDVNKVIFACPMTNFNICGTAKNYLDHILVANKTFSYKYAKKGDAIGLMQHLKVQLLTTQGAPLGWYSWGNHTENLKGTFEFIGAKVSEPIIVDGNNISENSGKSPKERIDEFDSIISQRAKEFASLPNDSYTEIK